MLRLFRRDREPEPAAAAPVAALEDVITGPRVYDLADYAEVLKLEAAPPRAEDDAAQIALADRILAHYEENRPTPESFPAISLQVINLVESPKGDAQALSRLVSQDPALAATMLRVANSAMNKGVSRIETLRDAIARLGLVEVGRIASAVSAGSLFQQRQRGKVSQHAALSQALFLEAVSSAMACAWLALSKGARSDHAYLGGLLHDVGRSIALRSLEAVSPAGALDEITDQVRLLRVLERVHLQIGADVHRAWELPGYLVNIAEHHHDAEVPAAEQRNLHFVRVISALAGAHKKLPGAAEEMTASANALGMDPFELRAVDSEVRIFEAKARIVVAS